MRQTSTQGVRTDRYTGNSSNSNTTSEGIDLDPNSSNSNNSEENPTHRASSPTQLTPTRLSPLEFTGFPDLRGSTALPLTLDTSNSDYIVDRSPAEEQQPQLQQQPQGSSISSQPQHSPQQQQQSPLQQQQRVTSPSYVAASPTTPVGDSSNPKREKKNLRRFFGLGGGSGGTAAAAERDRDSSAPSNSAGTTSSPSPSTAGRLFGRTLSTRNRPNRPVSQQILSSSNSSTTAAATGADNSSNSSFDRKPAVIARSASTRKVLTKQRPTGKGQQDRSHASRPQISHPAPIAEHGSESRSSTNPSFRHSIAILPGFDAAQQQQLPPQSQPHTHDSPRQPQFEQQQQQQQQQQQSSQHGDNLHSPSFHSPASESGPARAPYSVFNTSAAQSPDIDEGGSQPSSLWSGNRAPGSTQYQAYNGSQYLQPADSRPSSRQSFEPPPSSPTHSPYIAYHSRAAVSRTSINLDVSRDPSPLHTVPPSLQRGHSSQSTGQSSTATGRRISGDERRSHETMMASDIDKRPAGTHLDVDNAGKKPVSKAVGMVANGESVGRSTPPPSKSKEELASLDFPQLLSKHEELNEKYRKVKKYYFEKDAQVTNLQNTLAHQRLSQSRTSLDDNEYSNRFQRLDGAINNLAFNVRKDWKAVPPWLSPFVNNDAAVNKTKEMTAVGRACISRWLVDEIFDRVFHPGLEPNLSSNLKIIERNLRRFAPPVNTDDERDALLTKISNWRLATLDGLAEALNSPAATDYRTELTRGLVETLTSDLQMNLNTPPPAGLEAGVVGIIELAVGVAANLPLESRDVYVEYILPGVPYQEAYMKIEASLPALLNPGESYPIEGDPATQQRRGSTDESMAEDSGPPIGGFVGAGPKERKSGSAKKGEEEKREAERVRFAAFMSVMVKGKSMLVKAPVYV